MNLRKLENTTVNYDHLDPQSVHEGTFVLGLVGFNGVMYELLDLCLTATANDNDQREKIKKLLDIWGRSKTFDKRVLGPIEEKYFGSTSGSNSGSVSATGSVSGPGSSYESQVSTNQGSFEGAPPPPPMQFPGMPTDAQGKPDPNMILQMLQQMQSSGNFNGMNMGQFGQSFDSQSSFGSQGRGGYAPRGREYQRGGGYQRGPEGYQRGPESFRERSPRNDYGGDDRDPRDFRDRGGYERREVRREPPKRQESSLLNPGETNTPGTLHYRERNISYDHETLPNDCIKVYSRTLFIGGVTPNMDERYLATILRPYAEVQSVILNTAKKHAFVKVYLRNEAKNVFALFNKDGQYNLRLRWGVGFGPRDCCNYQNGISIIPILRLTDADKRWMTSAEWGGTGGKPLEAGMCVDEPDIEIGRGVSSKAILKKMPTDSTRNGPKSTKPGVPDDIYSDPLNESIGELPVMKKEDNPLLGLFGGEKKETLSTEGSNDAAVAALLSSLQKK